MWRCIWMLMWNNALSKKRLHISKTPALQSLQLYVIGLKEEQPCCSRSTVEKRMRIFGIHSRLKSKLTPNERGTITYFHFYFPMPRSVNISCWFIIWSTLHQIFWFSWFSGFPTDSIPTDYPKGTQSSVFQTLPRHNTSKSLNDTDRELVISVC